MDLKIFFSIIISVFLFSACQRDAGSKAKLTIQFPEVASSSVSGKVTAQSESSWASVTPTGFTGNYPINCFGVYITGPESSMRSNQCGREGVSTPMKYIGKWKGAVAAGKTLELEVDSGKDRVVGIFGFHATDMAACKDITGKAEMDKASLSKPYFIGEKGNLEFVAGQTVQVPITLAFDSNQWFDDCKGPDFQGGSSSSPGSGTSPTVNFGDGSDGNISVASGLVDVRNVSVSSKNNIPLITTTRVVSLASVSGSSNLLTVGTTATSLNTKYAVGDEVALYVAAAAGNTACGGNVFVGFRNRGIVQSVTSQNTMNVNFDDARFASIPTSSLSANSSGSSRDFCRVVVTRVPQINTLTFQGPGGSAAVLGFNSASFGDMTNSSLDHEAGLIIIRVKDKIILNSDAMIDVSGRGFSGGSYTTPKNDGQGILGASYAAPTGTRVGSGGAGAYSTGGAGGGGHGGVGGNGYQATGSGGGVSVGDQYGCSSTTADTTMSCLFGKIFMGGGGGSNGSTAGGGGGGIIILTTKAVQLNSYRLALNADGLHSMVDSTGSGGGAGGSVLVTAESIQASAATAALKLRANGGISKKSGDDGLGVGGGGAGGRNHLFVTGSCSLIGPSIALESYGGGHFSSGQGAAGGVGTNYLSGLGISSCNTIGQNQSIYPVRVNPDTQTASSTVTFTVYGQTINSVVTASIKNLTTQQVYNCTISNQSTDRLSCTVTSPTAAQYDVILVSSTGHKSVLSSSLTLN